MCLVSHLSKVKVIDYHFYHLGKIVQGILCHVLQRRQVNTNPQAYQKKVGGKTSEIVKCQ